MTDAHDTHIRANGGEAEDSRAHAVEDAWARILRKYADDPPEESISDDQIQRILRALQAHPTLALGGPTRDQIESITTTAIDKLDLVAHGPADDADEADRLAEELKQALQNGLHGDLVGPSSLLEPYELQAGPDRIDPTGADGPPQSGVAPAAAPQQQMSDDPNDNTDDESTANTDDPADGDEIPVEPADLTPEADANPGAPGGAGVPAAGAANPAGDADDAAAAGAGDDADQPAPDELDIELHDFIAEQVVRMMDEEHGLTEEQKSIAGGAAMVALENHQDFLRDHLLSSVDENAREIIFDSAVVEPMEDTIEQMIREQ